MKCEHFCNAHCSFHCPDADANYIEETYGIPASDAGYEHMECKDCPYNDKHCGCDDCYFKDGKECPRTEVQKDANHSE